MLIQILLPARSTAEGLDALSRTRRELTEWYGGVTAYLRAPARGAWVAPDGTEEHDDMIMVEVVTDTFDHGVWRAYERELAARFGETEIHIRAIPAETIRPSAAPSRS